MIAYRKRRGWKWAPDMAHNSAGEIDRLVRENWGLAHWFARRSFWCLDLEAAMSVATDGLLRAAQTFDAGRGVPFSCHATIHMRGFLSHERTRRAALKRGAGVPHVELEAAFSVATPFIYPE